jgi:hypothetical protein
MEEWVGDHLLNMTRYVIYPECLTPGLVPQSCLARRCVYCPRGQETSDTEDCITDSESSGIIISAQLLPVDLIYNQVVKWAVIHTCSSRRSLCLLSQRYKICSGYILLLKPLARL